MRRLALLLFAALLSCDGTTIEGRIRPSSNLVCGDMRCDRGETCGTCARDCGECAPGCGDETCSASESCGDCPDDCGVCAATCGDGVCDADEDCTTCAMDCGACGATCGDATCDSNESCATCATDCGDCGPICGDGTCDPDETCGDCAMDCGACPTCGDGTCDPAENCGSCEADCGMCTWPPELETTENEMLVLVNELRAAGARCGGRDYPPVPPLAMHEALREAARLHSLDMGEQNYFDHDSLDGRSPWDRIQDANYPGRGAAENIAAGNQSADATFGQWLNSPGHCRNMMTDGANEIGIGHAYVRGSRFGHYWTQAFGRR